MIPKNEWYVPHAMAYVHGEKLTPELYSRYNKDDEKGLIDHQRLGEQLSKTLYNGTLHKRRCHPKNDGKISGGKTFETKTSDTYEEEQNAEFSRSFKFQGLGKKDADIFHGWVFCPITRKIFHVNVPWVDLKLRSKTSVLTGTINTKYGEISTRGANKGSGWIWKLRRFYAS